jgi:hypothetical protein
MLRGESAGGAIVMGADIRHMSSAESPSRAGTAGVSITTFTPALTPRLHFGRANAMRRRFRRDCS